MATKTRETYHMLEAQNVELVVLVDVFGNYCVPHGDGEEFSARDIEVVRAWLLGYAAGMGQ